MKKILSLGLALLLCLSLCACGDGITSPADSTAPATNADIPVVYDHTAKHALLETLYGEWFLNGTLSWIVMPTKLVFKEDGTCFSEFPEHATNPTMDLYWGIIPDCLGSESDLYIRIGLENDIWYLFHIKSNSAEEMVVQIAQHSNDPDDPMIPVDGLTQDGYTGMWFEMKNAE